MINQLLKFLGFQHKKVVRYRVCNRNNVPIFYAKSEEEALSFLKKEFLYFDSNIPFAYNRTQNQRWKRFRGYFRIERVMA